LSDWENVAIAHISDRASAIANLTLDTAEPMQVTCRLYTEGEMTS